MSMTRVSLPTYLAVAGWLFAHYQTVSQSAAGHESRKRSDDVSGGDSSVRAQPPASKNRPVAAAEPLAPAAPNYDKDLKESQDVWQFAEGILASAKSAERLKKPCSGRVLVSESAAKKRRRFTQGVNA